MNEPMKPEQLLADKFLRFMLTTKRADRAFSEVIVPDHGTADIVLFKQGWDDGQYAIVETKMAVNETLIDQCRKWDLLANRVFAVVDRKPKSTDVFLGNCTAGLWFRDGETFKPILIGEKFDMRGQPAPIAQFCTPNNEYTIEKGSFIRAGTGAGKRATVANVRDAAIIKYIAENPGCTAAEAGKIVNMRASVLLRHLERELTKDVRIETGSSKSTLYAVEVK